MSTPILRDPALRQLEIRHRAAEPPLMARAGAAATQVARQMLGGRTGPVLIACGPGNNGGDGLVVARLLMASGIETDVMLLADPAKLPKDARAAWEAWQAEGGRALGALPERSYALAIDALFGIGLKRPIDGAYGALIEQLNALPCPVLALDTPSGLGAETGQALGCCIRATRTATFIALKPGLLTLDGPDHCGEISTHDLDLGAEARDGALVTTDLFRSRLHARPRNSHKGSFGDAGIIGGAPGMTGAALLAGRAALRLGAGRVYVGLLDPLPVDAAQPELMLRSALETIDLASALAVGPGLGQSATAVALLREAMERPLPLVLDADALNLLAAHPVLAGKLARRPAATLLTPHPAEAARLLGITAAEVQADRVESALSLARRLGANLVLKGCGSVIATPDGQWFINSTGNPGLASAGSGDVLAGLIVSLLAQGWPGLEALLAAVHLHGQAADDAVAAGLGPVGLTAGESIDFARRRFNRWTAP